MRTVQSSWLESEVCCKAAERDYLLDTGLGGACEGLGSSVNPKASIWLSWEISVYLEGTNWGTKKEKRVVSAMIVYVAIVVVMMKLKLQILGLIYGELIMSLSKSLFGKSEKGYHLIRTIHFGCSVWWKNNSFSKKYSYVYITFQNIQ